MAGKPGAPRGPRVSIEQRLMRRRQVDSVLGCWVWTGAIDRKGYGRIQVAGRLTYAHRVAWEVTVGPIPDGRVIDHVCENRACFRPGHLELVTHAENTRRQRNAKATRTHCPRGHRYAGSNLRTWVDGKGYSHRICVACNKIRCAEYRTRLAGDIAS